MAGKEIVQLYISRNVEGEKPGAHRPIRQLKGFEKVEIQPGETRTVCIEVPLKDVTFWSYFRKKMVIEEGSYTVATVDADGIITAVGTGTAKITAAACRGGLYLAGMDSKGCAHLFFSATGFVWSENTIAPLYNPALPASCSEIRTILESPSDSYIYLVCENGYLVTLPGCPKCVKETRYSEKFLSARIEDDTMIIQCESEQQVTVWLAALQQLRTSWSYAISAIQTGALLIDLRDEDDCEQTLPFAIHKSVQDTLKMVREMPKEEPLYLFCYTGTQADTITQYARYLGHMNTFSLGGPEHLLSHNDRQWPAAV